MEPKAGEVSKRDQSSQTSALKPDSSNSFQIQDKRPMTESSTQVDKMDERRLKCIYLLESFKRRLTELLNTEEGV